MLFDCFTFYNELDLLEVRLHEHHAAVDHFVLVEARQTFQGVPKELVFEANKQRFAPFLDKIIHVVVDFPQQISLNYYKNSNPAWNREFFQRDAIATGLRDAKPGDLIMISDVDEIVRSDILASAVASHQHSEITFFEMPIFQFCVDRPTIYRHDRHSDYLWIGPRIIDFSLFSTAQNVRMARAFQFDRWPTAWFTKLVTMIKNWRKRDFWAKPIIIRNAGWHFTSMGSWENYRNKIQSYNHPEFLNDEKFKSEEAFRELGYAQTVDYPFEDLPKFIRQNQDRFIFFGADRIAG